jgi:hypothetical protein
MQSSGMWRRVDLVSNDVSEERITSGAHSDSFDLGIGNLMLNAIVTHESCRIEIV